jgi:hypothetical protein
MTTVVNLREEATGLAPHRKADAEFFCYELKVGSEVHFRRRNGEMAAYRVWGFRKVERSKRMAKHNQRVHPKDTIILKEIGVAKTFREVGAFHLENWSRWGLVRDE